MLKDQPPKWAERLLLSFLKEELVEEVLGDLDEKFYSLLETQSLRKAQMNYWYQVFNYMRPFAFKNFNSNPIFYVMIKHNFIISFRTLLKNKLSSFINIGGLAIGMTVVMLVGLWMHDEISFNKYHDNYDQIVQVLRQDTDDGIIEVSSSHVGQLGIYLKDNYPNFFDKVAMTFYRANPQLLTYNNQVFEEMGYFFQAAAPEMLSLQMISGTRDGLKEVNNILISESFAKKCFGDQVPIGQAITINSIPGFTVAGVYKDLPRNTTFNDASFFAPMGFIYNDENPYTWDNFNMKVFATLNPGVDIDEASLAIKEVMNENREEDAYPIALFLHPMKDWHLHNYFENGVQVTSKRLQLVNLIGLIGLFVLILAGINFINLNTARYQTRAKEVGVRKTLGSKQSYLIAQFLSESVLYAFAAFCISILTVQLILPWFNGISDKAIAFPWANVWFWILGLSFTFITAILAGIYPAIFLSSFKPIRALGGRFKQGKGGARFRQSLVVFQFTISIILIIGTITIYQQIQHAKNRPMGYNQAQLITVRGFSEEYYQKYDLLRSELKKTGMVEEVAEANYPLSNTLGNNGGFSVPGGTPFNISFNTIYVTPEYGKTTGWELIAGRDFSRELGDESGSIILSESAIQKMGLQDPIGQQIISPSERNGRKVFTIIGVVKDMIKGSPFEKPMPLMVFSSDESERFLFIKIKPSVAYASAIPKIKSAFEQVAPTNPFSYSFVDEEYLAKFRAEEQIGSLATFFSVLAILISCLGLFGLSAFVAERRTKEIGIRKVLGASIMNLWQLLSKDFGLLIIIASVIAIPLSGYFLNSWLQSYEYRIPVYWWIYAIGAAFCLVVTIATVSYHSLRVSLANPVESLRTE